MGPYGHHSNFIWTLSSTTGIALSFNKIDLESHANCDYDYVEVFNCDGDSITGKLCEGEFTNTLLTVGFEFTIVFHSDSSVNHDGFELAWETAAETTTTTETTTTMESTTTTEMSECERCSRSCPRQPQPEHQPEHQTNHRGIIAADGTIRSFWNSEICVAFPENQLTWSNCADVNGGMNTFMFEEDEEGWGYIKTLGNLCWSVASLDENVLQNGRIFLKPCVNFDLRQRFWLHRGAIWVDFDEEHDKYCVPFIGAGEKLRSKRCYDSRLGF